MSYALFDLDMQAVPDTLQEAVEHGEVFTRSWIVETILDCVGYTADRDLAAATIVEPACGAGAFVGPIIERLTASCRRYGRTLQDATNSVRAFDLLKRNVQTTRSLAAKLLVDQGWCDSKAATAVESWISEGDFLLQTNDPRMVDFVVGNPPYIRLEDVPDARMNAYRTRCPTMGGRADIYVGFYEIGLRSLKPGGRLGFICADRWMRNQYGRQLRELISSRFSVELILTMHDVDAFEEQVSAYPAITIIQNSSQGVAISADTTRAFGPAESESFRSWSSDINSASVRTPSYNAGRLPHWFSGGDSWPAASPARLAMLEDLSDRFPLLEDRRTGTRVGIGVATGADGIFVTHEVGSIEVEADRLLPLAMVRDTKGGAFSWTGAHLVNPWGPDGKLVELANYPLLARYFTLHSERLRRRHIAIKQPGRWYKTIDKVNPHLAAREKLLFPDMKANIHPVFEPGGFYPHHNLYYIVSDSWDLRVLGGLLLSGVAEAFIAAYAVRMRGGTLRFQAQYLRRIRVPHPDQLDATDRAALTEAFDRRDTNLATQAALRAYGLRELPD